MTKFPIVETAFSGYRLLAAKPGTTLIWFLFQLAVALFAAYVAVSLAGPQLTAMKEMQTSGTPDPATMMTLQGQMLPYTIFTFLFPILVGSIAVAAVARALLRPAQGGLGYLRFGADELRVLVVYVVLTIMFIIPYFIATAIGMGVLMGVGGREAAMALSRGAFGELAPKAIAFALLAMLPILAVLVFLAIKLSLGPVQTVAERSIRLFESWKLTKGNFWRILAVYVLAVIPLAVLGVVGLAAVMAMQGVGLREAMQPDVSSLAAAFSGPAIVALLLAAAFQTLVMAQTAPAATIDGQLVQGTEAGVFVADEDDDDDDDED